MAATLLTLRGNGQAAVMPPGLYETLQSTGAPFGAVKGIDGAADSESLYTRFASRSVAGVWDRFISIRDALVFFLALNVVHIGLSLKFAAESTVYDDCASASWLVIFYAVVLLVGTALVSVIRSTRDLSITYEAVVAVLNVTVATILAASSAPHRWKLSATGDVCSAMASNLSYAVYFLADVCGAGSMIALVMILFARPPAGNGLLWVLVVGALAIVVQLTLFDLVLVDELGKAFREIEVNGTAIDKDMQTVTDRLDSLESLLNTTL